MKTLAEQYANWCIHFNGIGNDTCKVGIPYSSVRGGLGVPCLKDHGCSELCPSAQFPTSKEVACHVAETEQQVAAFLTKLAEGKVCPHCQQVIERKEQVGRCVYAVPCQHRLYQGKLSGE